MICCCILLSLSSKFIKVLYFAFWKKCFSFLIILIKLSLNIFHIYALCCNCHTHNTWNCNLYSFINIKFTCRNIYVLACSNWFDLNVGVSKLLNISYKIKIRKLCLQTVNIWLKINKLFIIFGSYFCLPFDCFFCLIKTIFCCLDFFILWNYSLRLRERL